MSSRHWDATAILFGLLLIVAAPAAEAKRVALVIGNNRYQSATPLQNARSDARAVTLAPAKIPVEQKRGFHLIQALRYQ